VQVEVDLSGRVGQTTLGSAMAFSNGESYSIFLPAYTKRRLLYVLRRRGYSSSKVYYWIYCAMLFYLLKPYLKKIDTVILDQEYTGKENEIKSILGSIASKKNAPLNTEMIHTGQVGKRSRAHTKAIVVLRGDRRAGKILSQDAVLELLP
jgi:hypothetical protein